MKRCKVFIDRGKGKETIEADFYGLFQRAYTHQSSALVGKFPPGQVSYPVAVVDWGEGLLEVQMHEVIEVSK